MKNSLPPVSTGPSQVLLNRRRKKKKKKKKPTKKQIKISIGVGTS